MTSLESREVWAVMSATNVAVGYAITWADYLKRLDSELDETLAIAAIQSKCDGGPDCRCG